MELDSVADDSVYLLVGDRFDTLLNGIVSSTREILASSHTMISCWLSVASLLWKVVKLIRHVDDNMFGGCELLHKEENHGHKGSQLQSICSEGMSMFSQGRHELTSL